MSKAAGRPRDTNVDERISRAALELLREHGPEAVHIDAVATRSGVARTTIYRRHRNREALLAATLAQLPEEPLPAADLPVEAKVRWLLDQMGQLVEVQFGRGAIASVLSGSDPVFSAALRARLRVRFEALQHELDMDIAEGRVRRGADADVLAGVAFGAYVGELLQHGRPRPHWADGVTDLLLRGLEEPPAP